MIYYCKCCNYSTNRVVNYKKHLITKKHLESTKSQQKVNISQQKVNNFATFCCKYCEKQFTTKQSMYRHIKYSCKKNKDEDLKELVRLLNEQNQEIRNELKTKNEQINKFQRQIVKLSNKLKIKNIHNNTQNNNNTINYNIQLLNYNDTDYSHLTTKDYIKCINDCNHCVKTLIEKVHFNNKKPENKNIYISNIKNGYILLYKDNKWQLVDRKTQIDDLYDYNEVVLDTWYRANKEKHPDIIASFTRYLKNMEEGNDLLNNVKQQILLMLYNNRLLEYSNS
jgi:hypothetical protein